MSQTNRECLHDWKEFGFSLTTTQANSAKVKQMMKCCKCGKTNRVIKEIGNEHSLVALSTNDALRS